ncbi:MAG: 1,4-alpha-glucan branching protein GlgB [Deltaproteobacteria bacterium]|nr:1,4-alpha-glucan branching protein GlgB [Deltaproteobacteria bacterium]
MTTLLTADDLFLFNQGTHYRLYKKLGAHIVDGGTYFAVWAPNARGVSVIGDWNGWRAHHDELHPRAESGIWEGVVKNLGHGARYKFAVVGADGVVRDKADPFAVRAEHPPATASIVWQPGHAWGDEAWMRTRYQRMSRAAPISIYEVHLGSWRRDRHEVLGYRDLGTQLADHCANLGFTHVELMPIMEHPFYGSWGYQVTGFFAPTTRYGAPDDLMAMIDTLHQRGIGVIMDWVPAHFPTDAHGLGLFDGTHLYEHADPRRGFHPDWTSYIFNYGRLEVKAFLISSAMSWLERYHIDGLRVDGVASMLYRDYSRRPGEWVPNEDGSNHDRDAIAFLQDFNRAVYTSYPDIQTIAEESTAWGGVSRPPENGGLGFGFKWDLGWMHDTLKHLAREPIHRKFHFDELTFRSLYAGSENYVLPLSHDEVVHGKRSLIDKVPGDAWKRLASMRLLFGYQWTLPGKKLLFMGGEIGVWKEWNHDDELDWPLGLHPGHAGLARWIGDLNGAYRTYPALHRGDCEPWGFRWLVADDRDAGVLAYARYGVEGDAPAVVVANFTPVVREGYRIGVPRAGYWREILNSDASAYEGSGVGNRGGMEAERVPCRGHEQSLVVTAPPLGVVVFVAEGERVSASITIPTGMPRP